MRESSHLDLEEEEEEEEVNHLAPFVGKRQSTWVVRASATSNLCGRLLAVRGLTQKSLLPLYAPARNDVASFSSYNPSDVYSLFFSATISRPLRIEILKFGYHC